MKYTIEFTTQHSGRLGNLIKNENLSYKTPIVLNYTKVSQLKMFFKQNSENFVFHSVEVYHI